VSPGALCARAWLPVQMELLPLDCDPKLPVGASGDMWGAAVDCLTVGGGRGVGTDYFGAKAVSPDGPGIYDLGMAVKPFMEKYPTG
jgi:hypothetical protein